jgi:pyruvate ferredoxin oxidoreductase alpha subunit
MIQLYVESSQEAYDTHVAAFKIAEDPDILLPVMVCMDGWVLTHSYEPVSTIAQEAVDAFCRPSIHPNYLDPAEPKTWGSYAEADVQMEINYSVHDAMLKKPKSRMKEVFAELAGITGRDHGGLIEAYRCDDAEVVLIALGSVCGTIKDAVDDLRARGQKVGLIKIRCYRPFPYEDILKALNGAKVAAVMEASFSMGSEGSIGLDLKAKLCNRPGAPWWWISSPG